MNRIVVGCLNTMDEAEKGIQIKKGLVIPLSELRFSFITSSGPGGQKVNKSATKVRLKWWPKKSSTIKTDLPSAERERLFRRVKSVLSEDGSVQVVSDRFRSRTQNRAECCRRLAERIRKWLKKPKKRIPSKPTQASKERRLEAKRRRSLKKEKRQRPSEE